MKNFLFMLLLAFSTLTANAQDFQPFLMTNNDDSFIFLQNRIIGSLGTIDLTPANRVGRYYKTMLYNTQDVDFNASIDGPGAPHWGQTYGSSAELTFLERLAAELDIDNGVYPLEGCIYIPSKWWLDSYGHPVTYNPFYTMGLDQGYYTLYIHLWYENF